VELTIGGDPDAPLPLLLRMPIRVALAFQP